MCILFWNEVTPCSKMGHVSRRSPGQILDNLDVPQPSSNPAEVRSEHPPNTEVERCH
jgi:hypothetical protein